jgi:hypothetical protein
MARFRFRGWLSLALVLALALTQTGSSQSPTSSRPGYSKSSSGSSLSGSTSMPSTLVPSSSLATSASAERSYKIYSLNEYGTEPGFGAWVAETIREVIATDTWRKGNNAISYYAPKNILVVSNTPAVQAKVEEFLADVKKSLPAGKPANATVHRMPAHGQHDLVPASYQPPTLPRPASAAPEPSLSYPVPAQAKPPKHLFHFIIRYEGEGIVDDNIVKAVKTYYQAEAKAAAATTTSQAKGYAAPSVTPPGPAAAPNEGEEKKADKKDKEKKQVSPDEPSYTPGE